MIPGLHGDAGGAEPVRDFDLEVQSFMVRYGVEIAITEVFHLSPQIEADDQIRQHNHVVIRAARAKQPLLVCMTTFNWDEFPVEPQHALLTLAGEAALLQQCEETYFGWCEAQQFDPDRRGVERKFRQTVDATNALRRMVGEAAYDELVTLYIDSVPQTAEDYDEDENQL